MLFENSVYAARHVCFSCGYARTHARTPVYAGNRSRQAYRLAIRPDTEMTRQLFVYSQIPNFTHARARVFSFLQVSIVTPLLGYEEKIIACVV